jgi:ABC-type Mn2+/Zn2+ transport system ATPase subunit
VRRFRRLQDEAAAAAAADAVDDASWHCNLGQLSGGQRTLVSLAMLLAVARAGGTCGLLLLDEIDAALDEFNQARVSALLRQLAHDRASACQVLCVTHNAGFQGSCDGFVRVTKSAAGHSVPADTEQQQQEAVRPAAGAAGGGKAGRKGVKQGKGPAAPGGTGKAKRVRFSVGG